MAFNVSSNLVNRLVNTLYQVNGKNPYSTSRNNQLATTSGAQKVLGYRTIEARTLENDLNDSWKSDALTLHDQYHPDRARQLSQVVVGQLDPSRRGWVRLNDHSFDDYLSSWNGPTRSGYISDAALESGLESGALVVGNGGQLLTRDQAYANGDRIITLHEDNSGAKLALDTGSYSSNPYTPPAVNPSPYDPYTAPAVNPNPYDPYTPPPVDPSPYDPYSSSSPYDPYASSGYQNPNDSAWSTIAAFQAGYNDVTGNPQPTSAYIPPGANPNDPAWSTIAAFQAGYNMTRRRR